MHANMKKNDMDDGISVDAYVEQQGRQGHALARLIQTPEPARGIVHTPREVAQQPLLWRHTARHVQAQAGALRAFLEEAGGYDGAGPRPTVVFAGAGTSDYVGQSVADLLQRQLQAHVVSWPTTRITPHPDVLLRPDRRYLMVHVARSGNSPESAAVLELGLRRPAGRARHLVLTCNADGELARRVDAHPDKAYKLVLHEASNDQGLAMTSSFSSMVVAAQALGFLDDPGAFARRTGRLAEAGEYVLKTHTDRIRALAGEPVERVFYLGSGDLFGAANESALKVQELTAGQLIAKGEDTLAFRHGPISAVNEHSLVCFFLSADAHARRYELDVLRQYQDAFAKMGTRVVLFADQHPDFKLRENVALLTYDPEGTWRLPALEQVNVAALFGQLFGLFAAYERGVSVDDPSKGSALYNRTVQGVRIYPYEDGASENGAPTARKRSPGSA